MGIANSDYNHKCEFSDYVSEYKVKKTKLNILVISRVQWSDTVASGNTFLNFFGEWKNANFISLYLREELPNNNICSKYYNITENQIVKHRLNPQKKVGKEFSQEELKELCNQKGVNKSINRERKMLDFFRTSNMSVFLLLRELLWGFGGWKNKRLDDFLAYNKIDIIFAAAADPIYLQKIVDYCRKRTGARLVLFFADDTYSYKNRALIKLIYIYFLRRAIRKSVDNATKIYGASQKLCIEFEKYFSKKIEPLYKGCSFEQSLVKNKVAIPFKIVYAGNLLYGRWKTLKALADEIEKVNSDTVKAVLEVYTAATVTSEIDKALNRGLSSKLMGARPYEDIKLILASADIVLHVESFDQEQIKRTRLSFSTKIIDGMQSGSCMMVIGPGCVASVEYLKRIEGAIVITDLTKIREVLEGVLRNSDSVVDKAKILNVYAREHHDINGVRNKLKRDFEHLIKD